MRNSKRSAGKTKKDVRRAPQTRGGRSAVSMRELTLAMADALEDILQYERRQRLLAC